MTKLTQSVLALAAATAFAAAFAGGPVEDTTSKIGADANLNLNANLSSLDKNGDGKLSQQEAAANKKLSQQFSKLDANHDGMLDTGEFARFEAGGSASGSAESKGQSDIKSDTKSETGVSKPATPTDQGKPAKP